MATAFAQEAVRIHAVGHLSDAQIAKAVDTDDNVSRGLNLLPGCQRAVRLNSEHQKQDGAGNHACLHEADRHRAEGFVPPES